MKVESLNRVENIVAKGEIVHYERFLLLSQCFQGSPIGEAPVSVCMWERLNLKETNLTRLENIVRKGDIVQLEQILL